MTIKTRPITEITLPKVTVCPPKNTFTNLNYDLMMLENMTMNNETREELTHYAVKLIQDSVFEQLMFNISLNGTMDTLKYRYHTGVTPHLSIIIVIKKDYTMISSSWLTLEPSKQSILEKSLMLTKLKDTSGILLLFIILLMKNRKT